MNWARNQAIAAARTNAAAAVAPMSTPNAGTAAVAAPTGLKASFCPTIWPSTWPAFGVAAAWVCRMSAVLLFTLYVKLVIRRVLGLQTLQTPENCIADIMLYAPLNIMLPEWYIEREGLFPPLFDAPFQHWDGPKTIGKSIEAHHLALSEKAKGNPVLYLSYKNPYAFEAFGKCFEDSVTPPNELNNHRQVAVETALGMFRNEGHVRSGFFRYWNKLFPSGIHPYAGDGLPLLIVDDLDLATQEDARRWAALGREGKFRRTYRTVILTSSGPSRTNLQVSVSDIITAMRVTFRDFNFNETRTFLTDLGITGEQRQCEIWHVVGGRPGGLASVETSSKSTHDIEMWREQLIAAARKTYTSTQVRLLEKQMKDDMDTMCKSLAQLLASDSAERCITISELARASGIDGAKTNQYWGALLFKVIDAGSVLWLQHGLCVRFETKHMQDFASAVLVGETLTDLSRVKCPASSVPGECGDAYDECDANDE